MAQNVGSAKVTISADFGDFEADLDKFFGKAGKKAGKSLQDGIDKAASGAKEAAESVVSSSADASERSAKEFEKVGEAAGKAAKDGAGKFGKMIQGIPDAAGKAAKEGAAKFDKGIANIPDSAAKTAKATGAAFEEIATSASSAGKAAAAGFGRSVSAIGREAQRAAGGAQEALKGISGTADDEGKKAVSRFRVSISGMSAAAASAVDGVRASFSKIGGALGSVKKDVTDQFGSIKASIVDSFSGLTGLLAPVWDKVSSGVVKAFSSVKDRLASVWTDIKDGATKAFEGIKDAAKFTGDAMVGILSSSMKAASAVVVGVTVAALAGGLKRLTSIDTAKKRLGALGADTERVMDSVSKSVDGTRFSMDDAAVSASLLYTSGVKGATEMDDALKALAAAASAGETSMSDLVPIFQEVAAAPNTMNKAFARLSAQGINAVSALATEMGITEEAVKEMATNGEISFSEFSNAIINQLGPLSAAMGTTLPGLIGNVSSQFSRLGAAVQQPIFNALLAAMPGVYTATRNLTGAVTELMKPLNDKLIPAGEKLSKMLSSLNFSNIQSGIPILAALIPVFGAIVGSAGGLLTSIPVVGQLFAGLTGPIGLLMGSLVALFAVSPDTLANGLFSIMDIVNQLPGIFDKVLPVIMTAFDNFAANLPTLVFGIIEICIGLIDAIVPAISAAIPGMLTALTSGIMTGIGVLAQELPNIITAVIGGIQQLAVAIVAAIPGVVNAFMTALPAIIEGILGAIPALITAGISLITALVEAISQALPQIITAIVDFIPVLAESIVGSIPAIVEAIVSAIPMIVTAITESLPLIIEAAVALFIGIIEGIVIALPMIIDALVEAIPQIVDAIVLAIPAITDALIENMPLIIDAAIKIFLAIIQGLAVAMPQIIGAIIELVFAISYALSGMTGELIIAAMRLFGAIITGLWDKAGDIFSSIGDVIGQVIEKVENFKDKMKKAGIELIRGLINGIKEKMQDAINAATEVGRKVGNAVKGFFKIKSPSKLFHQYGAFLSIGLAQGIDAQASRAVQATQRMARAVGEVQMPQLAMSATVGTADVAPSAGGSSAPVVPDVSGADFTAAAASMAGTADALLSPMWAQQTSEMQAWALQAQTQTSELVIPAMAAVGTAATNLSTLAWQPAMAQMGSTMGATSLETQVQADTVLNPALNSVGATAWGVLDGSVNPAMAGMRGAVMNTADSFGVAASNIATQWNRVREATASPARFAIQSVFNDGIVGMWNSVSDLLGTQKMGTYPVRFATGGYVRGKGGPKDDKIPALLSNKEFVVNAKATKAIGPANLAALNSGNYQVAPGVLRDPKVRDQMLKDKTFRSVASRYQGGGIAEGTPAWKSLLRGYQWAKSRNGRPYVWGGSAHGSGGTDCSGFMSGIADVIMGGSGARQWTTYSFPGPQRGAWKPGLAAGLSVGISDPHTAGTIGGAPHMPAVNVESGGVASRMKFGTPDAAGADDPQFPRRWSLIATDGGDFVRGAGSGASMADIVGGIMKPIREKMGGAAAAWKNSHPGTINAMPLAISDKLGGATEAKIAKLTEEMMSDPGGAGAERWRPMAKQAMARTGFDYNNVAQVNAMVSQIGSESGGNPGIMQHGYVDVNTGGNEAVGLLQIIPGTFATHRDPSLPNDRRHPFANMVAALRYYRSRYGMDLTTMWGHGHGYDNGGLITGAGLFSKQTTEAERVLSPRQTQSFDELVDFLTGPGWSNFMTATGIARSSTSSTSSTSNTRTVEAPIHFHGPVGTTEAADTIVDTLNRKIW